jgi:hypothetical protein
VKITVVVFFASMILVTAIVNPFVTDATAVSTGLDEQSWRSVMLGSSSPGIGCFTVTYPSTIWKPIPCGVPRVVPHTVGFGNDEVAQSSGTKVGESSGVFTSVSGITNEYDNETLYNHGSNTYSLQVNSQYFSCNTSYTNGKAANCWEQFLFDNNPESGGGAAYIEYWLVGYHKTYGACPPKPIPNGGSIWYQSSNDCYAVSASANTPLEPPTGSFLLRYSLAGDSSICYPSCSSPSGPSIIRGQPNDEVVFCDSTTCYSVSVTMYVLNLYSQWLDAEFNTLGIGGGSQAVFNAGTHITVQNSLHDQKTKAITPSCYSDYYTGETNNLNLGTCTHSSSYISFTESK